MKLHSETRAVQVLSECTVSTEWPRDVFRLLLEMLVGCREISREGGAETTGSSSSNLGSCLCNEAMDKEEKTFAYFSQSSRI